MGLYQECPNYSPGVKFGPARGMGGGGVGCVCVCVCGGGVCVSRITGFTLTSIGKTLEISLYLAVWLRLTKFCIQLDRVGL